MLGNGTLYVESYRVSKCPKDVWASPLTKTFRFLATSRKTRRTGSDENAYAPEKRFGLLISPDFASCNGVNEESRGTLVIRTNLCLSSWKTPRLGALEVPSRQISMFSKHIYLTVRNLNGNSIGCIANSSLRCYSIINILGLWWRRPGRLLMKKYVVMLTQQFLRDKRMVLHAHNEKDLESKVEDMTQADGRRLRADESEVVEFIIVDEQTVL